MLILMNEGQVGTDQAKKWRDEDQKGRCACAKAGENASHRDEMRKSDDDEDNDDEVVTVMQIVIVIKDEKSY